MQMCEWMRDENNPYIHTSLPTPQSLTPTHTQHRNLLLYMWDVKEMLLP
jgi:hypothetical protein